MAKENAIEIEDSSLKKIFDNETTLKSDKVHPNADGYALMAKSIARMLSENYHSISEIVLKFLLNTLLPRLRSLLLRC